MIWFQVFGQFSHSLHPITCQEAVSIKNNKKYVLNLTGFDKVLVKDIKQLNIILIGVLDFATMEIREREREMLSREMEELKFQFSSANT